MAINTEYLSGDTTDFTSGVSVAGETVLGDTLAVTGVITASAAINSASAVSAGAFTGTQLSLTNTTPIASFVTAADAQDMAIGEMRLVFAASGLSLVYSSGASLYDIGSNTSAVQPTS